MSAYRTPSPEYRPQNPRPYQSEQPKVVSILGPNYLKEGYFDAGGKPRVDIVTSLALDVARELKQNGMTSTQIRNFYNKAMALKQRIDSGQPFEDVKWRLQTLCRDAANSVGKSNAPEKFKVFIDKNVELAIKSKESFKFGFIEHFQSVIAYLNYLEIKK